MSGTETQAPSLIQDAPILGSQYRVTQLLGEGGMGRVFKAEHRITGQIVAIKVLRQELSSDPTFRTRFVTEARVLSRLDHPSITHLLNFIEEADGRLFLIMQFVAGRTLEDILLNDGALPIPAAMTIFHEVLDAFDYAHAQGIIHRDIKPANIVLPPGGGVKVMDFGIARMESSTRITQTGASMGSPGYMSPEQVMGKELDYRCDIYALGVMLYEMLVGDLPFPGENGYTVMKAHVEQPAPDPRALVEVPAKVADAVLWAMGKDPEKRPKSAAAFAEALPAAEDLGSDDRTSWEFIHGTSDTDQGVQRPPGTFGGRTHNKKSRGSPRAPATTRYEPVSPTLVPASVPMPMTPPGDPPRSSPLAAVAIIAALALGGTGVGGWWLGWFDKDEIPAGPGAAPSAALPPILPPTLVVKGTEMALVPRDRAQDPFYLDRTEVTYRRYRAFLEQCPVGSACGPTTELPALQVSGSELARLLDHPVTGLTHSDAQKFCAWSEKRLPTSTEWTRAASGTDGRIYPWGNDPAGTKAWIASPQQVGAREFFGELNRRPGKLPTLSVHDPVYYDDEGPFGLMGLGGNVSEWLADSDPQDPSLRMVAGGSWSTYNVANEARGTDRSLRSQDSGSSSVGFRCAMGASEAIVTGNKDQLTLIQEAGRLRVGAELECPPMLFKNEAGTQQGFEYELMKRMASALNVPLELAPAMYPDLPMQLRNKRSDIILAAYTPDESVRGVQFSASYLEYGLCLVVKKDSSLKSIKDLAGKRVGHYNDAATGRAVKALLPESANLIGNYETRYLEDVRDGVLDAFLYDFPFVQAELAEFKDSLRIAEFSLTEATYNIGVAEGEYSLLRAINRSIWALRSAPDYVELLRTWLGGAPPVDDIPAGAKTTLVQPGDTLVAVAKRELGDANRWTEIWELNRSRLGNQNLLYPRTPLVLPDK